MPIGDVIQLRRFQYIDGQTHLNVLNFQDDVGTSQNQLTDVWQLWDQQTGSYHVEQELDNLIRGYTSKTATTYELQKVYPVEDDPLVLGTNNTPSLALDTGLPTFAQARAEFATSRNDRSGRGRIFIGGVPEGQTTGNSYTNDYQNQMSNFLTALVEVFHSSGASYAGYSIGVFSRLLLEINNVTTFTSPSDLGTMRSRRLGRGE